MFELVSYKQRPCMVRACFHLVPRGGQLRMQPGHFACVADGTLDCRSGSEDCVMKAAVEQLAGHVFRTVTIQDGLFHARLS